MHLTSILRMIFATAESLTVPRSIVIATAGERLVVPNVTVQIAITVQANQIWRKTLIHNPKRKQRWNDFIYIFHLNLTKGAKLGVLR